MIPNLKVSGEQILKNFVSTEQKEEGGGMKLDWDDLLGEKRAILARPFLFFLSLRIN